MEREPTVPRNDRRRLIGLLPAAGSASRLPQITCSKEIYPIGPSINAANAQSPVAAEWLLRAMVRGGVAEAIVILRPRKEDIPQRLGRVYGGTLPLTYVCVERTRSILDSLDAAFDLYCNDDVVLGFPDVLLSPSSAIAALHRRYLKTGADVVLGLFPCDAPERSDMVAAEESGRVTQIRVKQPDAGLELTWMLAAWGPRFSRLLHSAVGELRRLPTTEGEEIFPGHLLQQAIESAFHVDSLTFPEGRCLDIGTPQSLDAACSWAHSSR